MYKLTNNSKFVIRKSDGTWIPNDPNNSDYREYMKWSETNKPDSIDLHIVQSEKKRELSLAYTKDISDISFTSSNGITKTYQADDTSKTKLTNIIQGFNNSVPNGFYWRSSDNTNVSFTINDLKNLLAKMVLIQNENFQKLTALKDKLNEATTNEEVEAINWS